MDEYLRACSEELLMQDSEFNQLLASSTNNLNKSIQDIRESINVHEKGIVKGKLFLLKHNII